MKLGDLFREAREARKFSQKQVAAILGVSPNYVSDIECNRKTVADFRRILSWSAYLGISNRDLLLTEG